MSGFGALFVYMPAHLSVCENVDYRGLEHESPRSHLAGLSGHDVSQEILDVLPDEFQLQDLLVGATKSYNGA